MGDNNWLEISTGSTNESRVVELDHLDIRRDSPLARVLEIGSNTRAGSRESQVSWEYSLRISTSEIQELRETVPFDKNTSQDERYARFAASVTLEGVQYNLALVIMK